MSPVYGRRHRLLRAREARRVAAGGVRCARGEACKYAEGSRGGLIVPGEAWDLGHVDGSDLYAGAEHSSCNRATMGHRAPRRRAVEENPGLTSR